MWNRMPAWSFASALAVLVPGCLVFDDYKLVEKADAGPELECSPGEFRCVEQNLQFCSRGFWTDEELCAQDKSCSAEVGTCVCKDDTYRCQEQRLQMCQGGSWSTQKDCSGEEGGLVCSASAKDCVCMAGTYSCARQTLLLCQGGMWTLAQECPTDEYCSSDVGRCVECQPGVDHLCDGTRLLRCSDDGSGFDTFVKDCALERNGMRCDTEVVPDDCFECRASDRRCMGTLLAKCMGNSFEAGGGTSCTIEPGCIDAAGDDDYCAQCSTPGEEGCSASSERRRCTEDYRWELIEQCAGSCRLEGASSACE